MKNMVNQKKTTITTSMVIAMLVVTAMVISKLMGFSFASNSFVASNNKYIIMSEKKLEVQFTGISKKSVTSVNIPDTVKIKGQTYKVTNIKSGALRNNKKVKKLTIGKNVKVINMEAFRGCKNLKSIVIKTPDLVKQGIGTDAFKGLNAKAVVTVPESKLSEYKKILKAKGFNGKKQKIKGKKMEEEDKDKEKEEEVPEVTFGPDHPLPDPDHAVASIGDISKAGSLNFEKVKVTESTEYSAGDAIPFSAVICMHPDIYGRLGTRDAYGIYFECNNCEKRFSSYEELAMHVVMSTDGCLGSCRYPEEPRNYTESYWIPDDAPCRVVFKFMLPEGLSYQEDCIKLYNVEIGEIDSSAYRKEIFGNELTIIIDDIKAEPFYSRDITSDASFRWPISVLFDTKMNGNTAIANTASATVSYSYKGAEKTIDLGRFTLYAASLQIKNTDASGNAVTGSKFALYKERIVYNGSNIGKPKFYKIAEGTSIDGLISFKGLSEGRYKLKQAVPAGYKPMSDIIFNVSMAAKDGDITSLAVKDDFGENIPWEADMETGVISAAIVNQ